VAQDPESLQLQADDEEQRYAELGSVFSTSLTSLSEREQRTVIDGGVFRFTVLMG
jgi:hypothetical protein